MQTSQQWWEATKNDPDRFNHWLVRQYTGEVTAASRITKLALDFNATGRNAKVLEVIAQQEAQHAEWIKGLLETRGVETVIEPAEDRYWAATLPGIDSLDTGTAVAAHAEKMRLDRIMVIANDPEAPSDVRETFAKILRDELFHERAFREMSSQEALDRTAGNHDLGMQALGLTH